MNLLFLVRIYDIALNLQTKVDKLHNEGLSNPQQILSERPTAE